MLYIWFVAIAFQLWWRSALEKVPSLTYFASVLDPLLGGISPKVDKCGWGGYEHFILTKFGKYPSSDSVVKADYVFQYIYMYMH